MSMTTMRERFIAVMDEALDRDPRVAVVLADITAREFGESGAFERHAERVINVGIREQAMVGVGAGLALEGMRPVMHTYAPFLVSRAYEQLKLDFGHQGLGGVFVSVGASYDAADSGRTHQAPEDVALISTLPGWEVHVPGHPSEAEALLRAALAGDGCSYVRLSAETNAGALSEGAGFTVLRRGSERAATVMAIGPMGDSVLEATRGLDVHVLYATTVRPFDGATLRELMSGPEVVLVEPYLAGTSAHEVSAALQQVPHRLLSLGISDPELRRYGTPAEHAQWQGLDVAGLRARIAGFVRAQVAVG